MLRFGIIGTNFVSDWFVGACRRSGVGEPVAVYSRDADRGRGFADRHGLSDSVGSLEALTDRVEAVYVASPNLLHHEQASRVIEAGRHVLCEKTLGATAAQTRDVFERARRNGVVAMEAIRPLYDPAFEIVRERLPLLGPIHQVHFDKQQYSSRYDRFLAGEQLNAFNPDLANSAAADIGVYCLEPALDLFGPPRGARGAGVLLDNGFEGSGVLVLDYPGMTVSCSWSKITTSTLPSSIHGELGTLVIDSVSSPAQIILEWRDGVHEVVLDAPRPGDADNMVHEVRAFAALVAGGAGDPRREAVTVGARELIDRYLAGLTPRG